jgi:protein xylosyltransferase
MVYLKEELKLLKRQFFQNVEISNETFVTIWGGADLLKMHLNIMEHLVNRSKTWKWDYVINLSETDLPSRYLRRILKQLSGLINKNF